MVALFEWLVHHDGTTSTMAKGRRTVDERQRSISRKQFSVAELMLDWVVPVIGGIAAGVLARLFGAQWTLTIGIVLIGGIAFQFITVYLLTAVNNFVMHSRKRD